VFEIKQLGRRPDYFRLFDTSANVDFKCVAIVFRAVMIATEISEAINAYSIAVAPLLFSQNSLRYAGKTCSTSQQRPANVYLRSTNAKRRFLIDRDRTLDLQFSFPRPASQPSRCDASQRSAKVPVVLPVHQARLVASLRPQKNT
jgi:hypothetical protein